MKKLPEIIMHYNVYDQRYYIYCGEDYIADYKDQCTAIMIFKEQCELLNKNKDMKGKN